MSVIPAFSRSKPKRDQIIACLVELLDNTHTNEYIANIVSRLNGLLAGSTIDDIKKDFRAVEEDSASEGTQIKIFIPEEYVPTNYEGDRANAYVLAQLATKVVVKVDVTSSELEQ